MLDHRVASRHPGDGHGQGKGDGGQQPFGHVGDENADEKDERLHKGEARHQPAEQQESDTETSRQQADRQHRPPELLLKGALPHRNGLGQAGDLADFRVHAGAENDGPGRAPHDHGTGKNHIGQLDPEELAMQEHRPVRLVALGRFRFAGERGVVHFHLVGFDEPGVGGDDIAFLQQQHIAGHDPGGIDLYRLSVPHHPALAGAELLQGFHRPARALLLQVGKKAVDHHHHQDGGAQLRHVHPGEEAHQGRHPEKNGEEAEKVAQQLDDGGGPPGPANPVGAMEAEPLLGLR